MQSTTPVKDNTAGKRFEIDIDGELAYLEYEMGGGLITFTHTFVPETLRGRGLAGQLVEAGLEAARARDLKVVPQCPMVAGYMNKHPATQEMLADEGRPYLAI